MRFLLIGIFAFITVYSSAQKTSYNDNTGDWIDDVNWTGGSAPATSNIGEDITINGYITRNGALSFNNGSNLTFTINDTLVVYGDVTLGQKSILSIGSSAVFIIVGDYTSENKAEVAMGGYFIVTGQFIMKGSDNQGSFENDGGNLFIFDPVRIKDGSGYTDIQCDDPNDYPDNCAYGNESDVNDDPVISDFFNTIMQPYSISASGPTSFCSGGSVDLSTEPGGSNYQWFLDAGSIAGANSNSYTATASGDYHVTFDLDGESYDLTPVTVTVFPLPLPGLSGNSVACEGDMGVVYSTETGMTNYQWSVSPEGSVVAGGSNSDNTVSVDWISAGSPNISVNYEDSNGCSAASASLLSVTVNELPETGTCYRIPNR